MPGFVPGIHAFLIKKSWMVGISRVEEALEAQDPNES
jgi:hypothetical protein